MFLQSTINPLTVSPADVPLLFISHGDKGVFIDRPQTFPELLDVILLTSKQILFLPTGNGTIQARDLVVSTSTIDVCAGVAGRILPQTYERMRDFLDVITVTVEANANPDMRHTFDKTTAPISEEGHRLAEELAAARKALAASEEHRKSLTVQLQEIAELAENTNRQTEEARREAEERKREAEESTQKAEEGKRKAEEQVAKLELSLSVSVPTKTMEREVKALQRVSAKLGDELEAARTALQKERARVGGLLAQLAAVSGRAAPSSPAVLDDKGKGKQLEQEAEAEDEDEEEGEGTDERLPAETLNLEADEADELEGDEVDENEDDDQEEEEEEDVIAQLSPSKKRVRQIVQSEDEEPDEAGVDILRSNPSPSLQKQDASSGRPQHQPRTHSSSSNISTLPASRTAPLPRGATNNQANVSRPDVPVKAENKASKQVIVKTERGANTTINTNGLFSPSSNSPPTATPKSTSRSPFKPATATSVPKAKSPNVAAPPLTQTQTQTQTQTKKPVYIQIKITHPATGQEAMFKTHAGHTVLKVLKGACKNFGIGIDSAGLILCIPTPAESDTDNSDGSDDETEHKPRLVYHEFECNKSETIGQCGIGPDSILLVRTA